MWQFLIPAATAVMGAERANRQANAEKQYNLAEAEREKYSPWTGVHGQLQKQSAPSMLEGAVGGGLQGLGIAQGMAGAMKSPAQASGATSTEGFSLGGGELAKQIQTKQDSFNNQMNPWLAMKPSMFTPNQSTYSLLNR